MDKYIEMCRGVNTGFGWGGGGAKALVVEGSKFRRGNAEPVVFVPVGDHSA